MGWIPGGSTSAHLLLRQAKTNWDYKVVYHYSVAHVPGSSSFTSHPYPLPPPSYFLHETPDTCYMVGVVFVCLIRQYCLTDGARPLGNKIPGILFVLNNR